jgi:transposase InsO family protein
MQLSSNVPHSERRKIIHFNVTSNPTAQWTGQQIVEAFPWDTTIKYIIRDRDAIYGEVVKSRIKNINIEQVVTAYKSPWQNPFAERLIGTIRRECLDHVIVLSDVHLKGILNEYFAYYHNDRNHLSVAKDAQNKRAVQDKPKAGKIIE